MNFISDIKDAREGARKAQRDIALAEAFFAEHNDKPPFDVAVRFFSSLGDDVNSNKYHEVRAYRVSIRRYQKSWAKRHKDSDATFGSQLGLRGGDVDVKVIAIPLGEIMQNLPDDGDSIRKMIQALLGQNPDYQAGLAESRRRSKEAGYCLGCGGTIGDGGECQRDGDPEWNGDPATARGNPANRVSETLTCEQKLAKVAQLRSRLDQLQAEYHEIGGMNEQMRDATNAILAEIAELEDGK